MHHYKSFIGKTFEKKYSKYCNIFKKHAKKVKANHKITVAMAEELEMQSINVTPGWKLCATCYQKVKKSDVGGLSESSSQGSSISSSANSDEET